MTESGRAGRVKGDEGAAMVEFAIVSVLLFTLIFGIITYGLLLNFKQDVTRAAAESARAGAVAFPATDAWADADAALDDAVDGFNQTCGLAGMSCYVNLHDCTTTVADNTPSNSASTGDCITVELVFDYDDFPIYPDLPLLSGFLPDEIRARSVARTND